MLPRVKKVLFCIQGGCHEVLWCFEGDLKHLTLSLPVEGAEMTHFFKMSLEDPAFAKQLNISFLDLNIKVSSGKSPKNPRPTPQTAKIQLILQVSCKWSWMW